MIVLDTSIANKIYDNLQKSVKIWNFKLCVRIQSASLSRVCLLKRIGLKVLKGVKNWKITTFLHCYFLAKSNQKSDMRVGLLKSTKKDIECRKKDFYVGSYYLLFSKIFINHILDAETTYIVERKTIHGNWTEKKSVHDSCFSGQFYFKKAFKGYSSKLPAFFRFY